MTVCLSYLNMTALFSICFNSRLVFARLRRILYFSMLLKLIFRTIVGENKLCFSESVSIGGCWKDRVICRGLVI